MATSVTSARVGREEATIESSIWVAVITGRASAPDERDDLLLHDRDLLDRQLDAEVAARDHHAVRGAHDLLGARDRLRLLDLRHQRQPRVLAQLDDLLGAADEAQRDDVDADPLARAHVLEVLVGHRGQRRGLARDVQALARGDRAADLDDRVDLAGIGADRVDPQPDGAVGEVHDLVALDRRGQPGVGDEQPRGVALAAVGSAHERRRVARA